jgi:DNA polymerase III delta prime subunit
MSLIIHEDIKTKLNKFIENKKIPNLIFHGISGCGKKTILSEFINKIYNGDKESIKNYVLSVNCAHGRGIKFIREDLKFFAKTNIDLKDGSIFKSIILINADKLTIDAQSALRRCIELFSHSTRFFIVVDDKYRLLKPILSRFCEIFIPEPKINDKIINLHEYAKNNVYPIDKAEKLRKTKLKQEIEKQKNATVINLENFCSKLYEKGYSALDIEEYIKESKIEEKKKYEYLVFIQKIKKEFRNEELLMLCILNFILIRSDYKLENISFM